MVCDFCMPFWLVQLVISWVQCTQRQWPTPGKAAHKINNFHQVFNSSFLEENQKHSPKGSTSLGFSINYTICTGILHKSLTSAPPPKKKKTPTKSVNKNETSRWLYVTCYPSPVVSIGLMLLALFHVLGPQILLVIHLRPGGRKGGIQMF